MYLHIISLIFVYLDSDSAISLQQEKKLLEHLKKSSAYAYYVNGPETQETLTIRYFLIIIGDAISQQ